VHVRLPQTWARVRNGHRLADKGGDQPGGAAHTVDVGGNILRAIDLHHPVHVGEIQPSCCHIRSKQTSCAYAEYSRFSAALSTGAERAKNLWVGTRENRTMLVLAELGIDGHAHHLLLLSMQVHHGQARLQQPECLVNESHLQQGETMNER